MSEPEVTKLHDDEVDIGASLVPALEPEAVTIRRGIVQLAGRTCSPAAQMAMQLIVDGSETKGDGM